ncbi:hypothetical protein SALBM135S_07575 [Streptomyces alboniger]
MQDEARGDRGVEGVPGRPPGRPVADWEASQWVSDTMPKVP